MHHIKKLNFSAISYLKGKEYFEAKQQMIREEKPIAAISHLKENEYFKAKRQMVKDKQNEYRNTDKYKEARKSYYDRPEVKTRRIEKARLWNENNFDKAKESRKFYYDKPEVKARCKIKNRLYYEMNKDVKPYWKPCGA